MSCSDEIPRPDPPVLGSFAAQAGETCAACYDGAIIDGTCNLSSEDCGGYADHLCCVVAGQQACRDNLLLLGWLSE